MSELNTPAALPRIPEPDTLILEIRMSPVPAIRIYTTEDGGRKVIAETPWTWSGNPMISDVCLRWAVKAARDQGYLVTGYRKMSGSRYVLDGPRTGVDWLSLTRSETGYELVDTRSDPPTPIDVGILESDLTTIIERGPTPMSPEVDESEALQIVTLWAVFHGYQPIGYRKIRDNHWMIVEHDSADPMMSIELSPPPETPLLPYTPLWQIMIILVLSVGAGVSAALSFAEIWNWMPYVSVSMSLLCALLVRTMPQREPMEWICQVCREQSVHFSVQAYSSANILEASKRHMEASRR